MKILDGKKALALGGSRSIGAATVERLVSDGDFVPAIAEIQRRGAEVIVVAKKSMLSQQLSQIANNVIFLDDIKYRIAKYTKLNVA